MAEHGRLKVLAVAAAAHPDRGSEPGLGWGWVEALSNHHDLWVITGAREGNREAIARRLAEVPGLGERLKVFFVPRPDGPRFERVFPPWYYRLYRQWHLEAFEVARRLASEVAFDLAHQINMTGYREPGYLWKLDLPFVWGPVGGTQNVPLRFASVLGPGPFVYHIAKTAANNLQLRFQPRVRKAVRRADGFVASTSDTRRAFLRVYEKESTVIPDSGPPSDAIHQEKSASPHAFRIAWSGLHVSRKALPLALHALRLLPRGTDWHLDIIGEGPMTRRWQRLAGQLGLEPRCTWHGWLSRAEARQVVAGADVFAFLSLHEGMPTVVMEALAAGVPVVCLDICGQGDVVDQSCGMKIPARSVRQVVSDTAEAIRQLASDPERRRSLSRGARERVDQLSWSAKLEQMDRVYRRAILSRAGHGYD
jgi:glycosyltransferase involved in cell wall biosynthesis